MYTVRVQEHIAAPIDDVFANFADYPHFFRGRDISSSTITVEGTPAPNGLGAYRRIVTGGLVFLEEIVAFEAPSHFEYLIRDLKDKRGWNVPMDHRLGRVSFVRSGTGTDVQWISTWSISIPLVGVVAEKIVGRLTTRAFGQLVAQAKKELEAP